jgi:hypothetical protein
MTLESEMRQILAELEMLGHGSVTAWNASGGGQADSRPPSGESNPPHIEYAERFERDRSWETVEEARACLREWKRRAAPARETDTSEDDWIIEDGEGYAADEVARRFNTTPARVRLLRSRNGREMEMGLPTSGRAAPKLRDLVEQGLTARQIEMLTGTARSTAQDAINRHRKAA